MEGRKSCSGREHKGRKAELAPVTFHSHVPTLDLMPSGFLEWEEITKTASHIRALTRMLAALSVPALIITITIIIIIII